MVKKKLDGTEIKVRKGTYWYYFNRIIQDAKVGDLFTLHFLQDEIFDRAAANGEVVAYPTRLQVQNLISRMNTQFGRTLIYDGTYYTKIRKERNDKRNPKQLTLTFPKKESKVTLKRASSDGPIELTFNSVEDLKNFLNL